MASEAEDEKYLRENVTILLSTKSENPARVGNVFILAQQIEDSLGWQLASSKRPSLPIPPPILIFKSSPNSIRIKERVSKGDALGGKLRGKISVLPTLGQVTRGKKVRLRPRGKGATTP